MDVLITYDIADTKGEGGRRLRRIASICEKYCQRVQLSVFECRLSPVRLARMIGEVQEVMEPRLDSLRVYRFPGSIERHRLRFGLEQDHNLGDPWII